MYSQSIIVLKIDVQIASVPPTQKSNLSSIMRSITIKMIILLIILFLQPSISLLSSKTFVMCHKRADLDTRTNFHLISSFPSPSSYTKMTSLRAVGLEDEKKSSDLETVVEEKGLEVALFKSIFNKKPAPETEEDDVEVSANDVESLETAGDLLKKYGAAYLVTSIPLSLGKEEGEGRGRESVVVPMMEIYPIRTVGMICVLHYGDMRNV